MEAAIDFKSLRAKFQEEIQSNERPGVPEKPKRFPHPAGTSSSYFAHVDSAAGASNPSEPSVIVREDRKPPSAKRPVSVPSCFQTTSPNSNTNGSIVKRQSFKDRKLPQVLPVSFSNEAKHDSSSSYKLITSPIKYNKKAIPTPFKPTKFSKCIKDIIEHAGESAEKNKTWTLQVEGCDPEPSGIGDGFNYYNGDTRSPSPNQEQLLKPPSPAGDSEVLGNVSHVLSTLEKAKRKFSPKNLLVYAKPKSFYSTKVGSDYPPPQVDSADLHHEEGSASLQAECPNTSSPTSSSCSSPLPNGAAQLGGAVLNPDGEVKPVRAGGLPSLRPLPHPASLGSSPHKPPRPPRVDLSSYKPCTVVHACSTKKCFTTGILVTETAPVLPPPQFDAPDFPDFESSVLEALNINGINLSTLNLEATEFGIPPSDNLLVPSRTEQMSVDLQKAQRGDEMIQRLIAGSTEAACAQSSTGPESLIDAQLLTVPRPDVSGAGSSETTSEATFGLTDSNSSELPSEPSLSQRWDVYEACDNVYEEVETANKFHFGQNSRKRKGPPKNPYADSAVKEEMPMIVRSAPQWANVTAEPNSLSTAQWDRKEQVSPDHQEDKELRKREKQRLERERRERKEREKKENEMKKKFKITGLEEPVYHARVLVASKLRKHDLQVKGGDTISIIRTTNCPKGKWLARDSQHNYGYISLMNVELNMKEMLELGRQASQAIGRVPGETDTTSISSRSSHQIPSLACSFTDSEEWSGDEDTLSPLAENMCQHRAVSLPNVFNSSSCTQSGSMEDLAQVKHEALQKLAVFFKNTNELSTVTEHSDSIPNNIDGSGFFCEVEEPPYAEEDGFSFTDLELLPPPDLYADPV